MNQFKFWEEMGISTNSHAKDISEMQNYIVLVQELMKFENGLLEDNYFQINFDFIFHLILF